jgi:hypothetical protein
LKRIGVVGQGKGKRLTDERSGMAAISLFELRSALADDLITYLAALEAELDRRSRRRRRPLRAIRIGAASGEAGPEQPQPLDDLVASLDLALIFGEPRAGWADWLEQFALASANEVRTVLRSAAILPEHVCIPATVRAQELSLALMPDREEALRDILDGIGVETPALQINQDSRRLGAALLLVLDKTFGEELPARTRALLWSKLWKQVDEPDRARALIVVDGWDELFRSERERLDRCLQEFIDQTAARVFIGSRYAPDLVPSLWIDAGQADRQVLCLWPYELPVPTPLPGIFIWRRAANLDELAQLTSPAATQRRPIVVVRRPRLLETVGALAGIVIGAAVIWQLLPPGLRITDPAEGAAVCASAPVEITAPADRGAVWAVVHPKNNPGYWVQPNCRPLGGHCVIVAHFGRDSLDFGVDFEIRAVADPSGTLVVEQRLPMWPEARLWSPIVTVLRRHDC